MRVMLFTGKGGVGKTTIAAATAARAARSGLRTLITSTDPAHSLSDSFDIPLGAQPTRIATRLEGQQIDSQERLEDNWRDIQAYLVALMNWAGVEAIQAEELSVIPGLDEIFALIDVKNQVEADRYDLLVVDCAPTAETLRLLSLPEVMNWYIDRIFPVERRVVKVVRPIVSRMTSMPIVNDDVFSAVERLHGNLEAVRKILTDQKHSSVRLVVNPERMVIAEARRTYTYLSLFGYGVDAVIANRIIPDEVTDPYFATWKDVQSEHLATIHDSFSPIPILSARLLDRETVGLELLRAMGEEVYGEIDEAKILHRDNPIRVRKTDHGTVMSVRLPFTGASDLDVHRNEDELFIRVGSFKRNMILPQMLRRMEIIDASMAGQHLHIVFIKPDAEPASAERKKAHG